MSPETPPEQTLQPEVSDLLASKRVLVTVGSGGVGKTTTAAALGLASARLKRKTLVMTIDPARRLATSLGLNQLDHSQREIPHEKMHAAGLPSGELFAMMLDQKQTFDEMVLRHAPDAETAQRLLASKIYQQLSARLAGAQEYAAMEKLDAIHQEKIYDLLLLDTPPTANALDFLDAPQKMIAAVDSPAVQLFTNAYDKAGKLSLNVLGFGAAFVIRRLARFTGGDFLDDIAKFLSELSGLLGGMRERAGRVIELFSLDEVGFIVVTSPDPRSINEAIDLNDRLISSGITPAGFVINMVHPQDLADTTRDEVARLLAQARPDKSERSASVSDALLQLHEKTQALARANAVEMDRLRDHCGSTARYIEVPFFDEDIHDFAGLLKISDYLAPAASNS